MVKGMVHLRSEILLCLLPLVSKITLTVTYSVLAFT